MGKHDVAQSGHIGGTADGRRGTGRHRQLAGEEMTTRQRYLLIGSAALAAFMAAFAVPAVHWRAYGWLRGERFYQGRPESYWGRLLAGSKWVYQFDGNHCFIHREPSDVSLTQGAVRPTAEKNLGADVEPLTRLLRDRDPKALPLLMSLIAIDNARIRLYIALILKDFGPLAGDVAIDIAAQCIAEPDTSVRTKLFSALAATGNPAIPPLIRMLQHSDAGVRADAAACLGHMKTAARAAGLALCQCAGDPDPNVRECAALALGFVHAGPPAIPMLATLLGDPEVNVRTSAAIALQLFGSGAREAVPKLVALLNDRSDEPPLAVIDGPAQFTLTIRKAAAMALRVIDPTAWETAGRP
jgi:hypothetical protein